MSGRRTFKERIETITRRSRLHESGKKKSAGEDDMTEMDLKKKRLTEILIELAWEMEGKRRVRRRARRLVRQSNGSKCQNLEKQ